MPKGIPITEEELVSRRREIFHAAMHLFVEKGFNETSMRKISQAAGLGKSTLYDYFSSKDEILLFFVTEEVGLLTNMAAEVNAKRISAAEKLRLILEKQLEHQIDSKQLYLRLTFETQRLSFQNQKRIQDIRHNYQDLLCSIVDEGIRGGEFRPVHTLLAVRGMLSLLSSAIYTTRPTGSPDEMLTETFDIVFKGLEIR